MSNTVSQLLNAKFVMSFIGSTTEALTPATQEIHAYRICKEQWTSLNIYVGAFSSCDNATTTSSCTRERELILNQVVLLKLLRVSDIYLTNKLLLLV